MDLVMPVMDGAEATRRIMRECPCPILIVTSSVATNFAKVYEAMGHGALDAVDTPQLGPGQQIVNGEPLLARLAKLEREQAGRPRTAASTCSLSPETAAPPGVVAVPPIVALAASTGGPDALARVLGAFRAGFPAAVLVAQHIAADFAPSLAAWLQSFTPLPVRVAVAGAEPQPGQVLIAATSDHLVLRPDRRLAYTPDPADNPYRPSADALFASVAAHWPRPGVAAVLTGMGDDGGVGLCRLRRCGWFTIAQDAGTCVVYGMPRAAAELGGACQVLPLAEIGPAICARLAR
jgi:two-component system response regulator WspF